MNWKDKKSCRTCIYADAIPRERIYAKKMINSATACLFPVQELEWPELPESLSKSRVLSSIMKEIKGGSIQTYVMLDNDEAGANCPQWKRWKQD